MTRSSSRAQLRAMMCSTAVSFALVAPATALAQAATPDSQAVQPTEIADVVVTARRTSETAQSVPISITTVTAEELRDLTIRNVAEIQKITPGLFIYGTGQGAGKAKLSIRGQTEVDDRLTGDRSVGVYIDGVSFDHDYGLTTALVDIAQVEVLKGPQGTLFGKNTTGGAINVTTQHPLYEQGGYASLQYGSYDRTAALAVLNVPLVDERLALRVVGQATRRDGYYHDQNGHDLNADNGLYGRLLVRADPTENLHILLSGDYIRTRDKGIHNGLTSESLLTNATGATALRAIALQLGLDPSLPASRTAAYNAYLAYFNASKSDMRDNFGNLANPMNRLDTFSLSSNVQLDIGRVTATSITAYRNLDKNVNFDLDNTPFALVSQRQPAQDEVFSQEFRLASRAGGTLDWQAGLFYSLDQGVDYYGNDLLNYANPSRTQVSESTIRSTTKAAYGQAVYNISPALRVTAGLRYTKDHRRIDSHNRTDLTVAVQPLPPGGVSRCNLLGPALGGPVYPDCSYVASVGNDKFTWLLSGDWRPVPTIMLYATVSTGYRSGAFNAPGFSSPIATVAENTAAFTPYAPETLTNYETGIKSDLLDRRLRVNGAFFYQDYKDVQVRARIPVTGATAPLQTISNAASATLYGGEVEVIALPIEHLTLNGTASYLHAEYNEYIDRSAGGVAVNRTSQPFPVPDWRYSLGASYEMPLTDGSVKLNVNYAFTGTTIFVPSLAIDNPAVLPAVTQKGYGLVDGRLSWRVESLALEVAVFGKNLANKRYASNMFDVGFFAGVIPGEPRTYGIELRKEF